MAIYATYDEPFIAALKALPVAERRWDERCWRVARRHLDALKVLAVSYPIAELYDVDGLRHTDLHTGRVYVDAEQLGLFPA